MDTSATTVVTSISVITEKAVEASQVIVQTVEEANTLTPIQKETLSVVFDDVKDTVQHIMIDNDVAPQIKIMQLISRIIKTVQDVCAMKSALTGADKKAIALECGRKCIKMMKDHLDILMLYDTIAEPALETMLELSRKMKPVQAIATAVTEQPSQECCMGLFAACMSLKSK